jgi:hypothetical protein
LSVSSVVCCQVEVFATSWSLVLEESYRLWFVVVCDLETSRMGRPWPALGRSATGKKKNIDSLVVPSRTFFMNCLEQQPLWQWRCYYVIGFLRTDQELMV